MKPLLRLAYFAILHIFPASTRAAVHGMTLTTGGRVIAARIRESAKARAEYETAKSEKKTAALLEEQRPNVFQMSVANLLPGNDVTVEVEWTDVPAWYWSALRHPLNGPWRAETVISR